jgi:predicted nucleotidyltransferase
MQHVGETMVSEKQLLHEIVTRIRLAVRPQRIVLFGSRARGSARDDSDFDFLVVKPSTKPRYRRSAPIYRVLADLPVEVEVMVYTPQEIRQWRHVPEAFVTTALREGKVLYEKPR